jgi:Uma2 family endonuclease
MSGHRIRVPPHHRRRAAPNRPSLLPGAGWIVDDSPLATFRVPDIMVVSDQLARQTWMDAAPLLAVEVVSRRSSVERDLVAKRRESTPQPGVRTTGRCSPTRRS